MLNTWKVGLTSRRYRRYLIATLISLFISATLLGLATVIRRRGHQALRTDAYLIIEQASQQLLRALNSRRGTLTFLRDTIDRQIDLTSSQMQAMGASAKIHTRHLLGAGLIQETQLPIWWTNLKPLSTSEISKLNRTIFQRLQLRNVWRVPSTFVMQSQVSRALLVMLEPLRSSRHRHSAIVGVFDMTLTLEDFFNSNFPSQQPVQLLVDKTPLYTSKDWQTATNERHPIIVEHPVIVDSEKWTMQMQPGLTRVVQTLSWLNVLFIGLSILAGAAVIIVVWILAARTWILQRIVARRTAALRRTSERLRQLAITDELTGLHNRRFFLDRWGLECERAKRYKRPLACLMIDINGFKQVNDHLGHLTGDLVLKRVAKELKTLMRQSDILARFGGDEFIAALPETSFQQAEAVAEKLRKVSLEVNEGEGNIPPVSLSVGIGRVQNYDESPQEILQAADKSLYASKHNNNASSESCHVQ